MHGGLGLSWAQCSVVDSTVDKGYKTGDSVRPDAVLILKCFGWECCLYLYSKVHSFTSLRCTRGICAYE